MLNSKRNPAGGMPPNPYPPRWRWQVNFSAADGHAWQRRCLPIPVDIMLNLGMAISIVSFPDRRNAAGQRNFPGYFHVFSGFFFYLIYVIGGTGTMYAVLLLDRNAYPSAFWYYYLITILVEFSVLVEISDHLFRPFRTPPTWTGAYRITFHVSLHYFM